jgi:hypothetical protein
MVKNSTVFYPVLPAAIKIQTDEQPGPNSHKGLDAGVHIPVEIIIK